MIEPRNCSTDDGMGAQADSRLAIDHRTTRVLISPVERHVVSINNISW